MDEEGQKSYQYLYVRFDVRSVLFAALDIDTGAVATMMVLTKPTQKSNLLSVELPPDELAEWKVMRQKHVDEFFNREYGKGLKHLPTISSGQN